MRRKSRSKRRKFRAGSSLPSYNPDYLQNIRLVRYFKDGGYTFFKYDRMNSSINFNVPKITPFNGYIETLVDEPLLTDYIWNTTMQGLQKFKADNPEVNESLSFLINLLETLAKYQIFFESIEDNSIYQCRDKIMCASEQDLSKYGSHITCESIGSEARKERSRPLDEAYVKESYGASGSIAKQRIEWGGKKLTEDQQAKFDEYAKLWQLLVSGTDVEEAIGDNGKNFVTLNIIPNDFKTSFYIFLYKTYSRSSKPLLDMDMEPFIKNIKQLPTNILAGLAIILLEITSVGNIRECSYVYFVEKSGQRLYAGEHLYKGFFSGDVDEKHVKNLMEEKKRTGQCLSLQMQTNNMRRLKQNPLCYMGVEFKQFGEVDANLRKNAYPGLGGIPYLWMLKYFAQLYMESYEYQSKNPI